MMRGKRGTSRRHAFICIITQSDLRTFTHRNCWVREPRRKKRRNTKKKIQEI
jgi:hypothetical protein